MTEKPNLADARRVTEAATGGPWAVPGFGDPLLGPSDVCTEGEPGYRHIICEGAEHDAEFIAASRTLIPALLAAVDAVLAVPTVRVQRNTSYGYVEVSMVAMADVRAAITAHLDIEPR